MVLREVLRVAKKLPVEVKSNIPSDFDGGRKFTLNISQNVLKTLENSVVLA